jgi:hypothetical protein
MPFDAKSKLSASASSDSASISSGSLAMVAILSSASAGRADDRHQDVANGDVVGIATEPRRLVLDGFVASRPSRCCALRGEDHLAPASGEALATAAGPGLNDHGVALRRPQAP